MTDQLISQPARLFPSAPRAAPPDGSSVGELVRWYRRVKGLTQVEVARLLSTSQSRLSKIESGTYVVRDVHDLRFIADRLGISPELLGVVTSRDSDNEPNADAVSVAPGPVRDSQREWLRGRRAFAENRILLSELAAGLYPDMTRVVGTSVLSRGEWMLNGPTPLDQVQLRWLTEVPMPSLSGSSGLTDHVRPLSQAGGRYSSYSRTLRDLSRPKLLDNRICYRLIDAHWTHGSGRLDFGYVNYFDVIDVCEAVGHEYAAAWLSAGKRTPRIGALPLRSAIVDPFDLGARPMYTSINTLTIRKGARGDHRFYLHNRDTRSVASAGGTYGVIPAGCFQPSSVAPGRQASDFSLWRNIQREFSEELLGNPEHDGQESGPIDYPGTEPFRTMDRLRGQGRLMVYAFGTVLDPLALFAEQLTVAVLDADAFDELFGNMVVANDEGEILTTASGRPAAGIPFTETVRRQLREEPLSPIGRACFELAWQFRRELLG